MKLSILTNNAGSLNKSIDMKNNSLSKSHPSPMSSGSVEHKDVRMEDLVGIIKSMSNRQAFVHGTVRGSNDVDVHVVVSARLHSENPQQGQVSRTKSCFEFTGSHLTMLDHDPDPQCPLAYMDPGALLKALSGIDNQWGGVAHVIAKSTSAGLLIDDKPVPGGDGYHLYFQADNAEQLQRYMEAIFKLSVIAGHGWIKLSAIGSMLVRSCFDIAVFSSERIDFTAQPTLLSDRLSQYRSEPIYKPGGVIDCSQVPDVDEEKYTSIVDKLKADPAIIARAEEAGKKQAEVIAKKRNISVKDAMRVVRNNINGDLSCDDEIVFQNHGTVTVADILKDLQKYDHEPCGDPVEAEKGLSRAMFFANADTGNPLIHTMLHGGSNYSLKPRSSSRNKVGVRQRKMHKTLSLKIQTPIKQKDFANSMVARITSLNPAFFCGGKVYDGFLQQAGAYNECVSFNKKGQTKLILLPSPTGSGKTVSCRLYLAQISKMSMSGLLVVGEVEVALQAAAEINKIAGSTVAKTYYMVSKVNPDHKLRCELDNLPQIGIITHSLFIQRSDTGRDIDKIRIFKGKQRDAIFIDESINLIKHISFTGKELEEVASVLKRDGSLAAFADNISCINEYFLNEKKSGNYVTDPELKPLYNGVKEYFLEVASKILQGCYSLDRPFRGRKNKSFNETERADVVSV